MEEYYKFNWERAARSDAERKKELEYFSERNGIHLVQPNFENCLWSDEIPNRYEEMLKRGESVPGGRFYLADVRQSDRIQRAITCLRRFTPLSQEELELILAFSPPMLRVSFKVNDPGSAEFRDKTYDLVQTAIDLVKEYPDYGPKAVLRQLLPYIDFSVYNRDEIMKALEE